MTGLAGSRAVTLSLLVVCAGLTWAILGDDGDAVRLRPAQDPAPPPSSPLPEVPAQFRLPPIESFGEIVARPLFNVSRRPISSDSQDAGAADADLAIMLSGIVIDADQRIAHVRATSDDRVRALGPGDRIADWRIEAIEPDRVILRAGNRFRTVYLRNSEEPAVQVGPGGHRRPTNRER